MFSAMKHAKKMQLVEYREPCAKPHPINIYNKPVRDEDYASPTVLQKLDDEMGSILNNTAIDDGQKWLLYEQTLGRYLGSIKRMRQAPDANNEVCGDTAYAEESADVTSDDQTGSPTNLFRGLQFLADKQQQQDQQQGAIPKQKQQKWKGTTATKKMITRRNAEPWDLVSPLHTPRRKRNADRRIPYKARYKKGGDDARSEVSNRRNNNFDSAREAFNDGDDDDMSYDIPSSHYPFRSSNITSTRTSPIQTQHGLPITRPCSVRIDNSITSWLQSNIKK